MASPFRSVLMVAVTAVVWAVGGASAVHAQVGAVEPTVRAPGTVTNVFETLDPAQPLDGLRVRLPASWTFESVRLLRYGTKAVPASVRPTDEPGTHVVTMDAPLSGPHDLVLRVGLPETPGTFEWSLHTLERESPDHDTVAESPFRVVDRHSHRVAVEAPPEPDPTNRALSMAAADEPLMLRPEALPPLGQSASFTIEFWLRTSGLDEVVLSTWNGQETVAYPAEFVVDQGGRLRFYTGRPGEHRALRTGQPVADGAWHHVAVVYDAERSRLRLLMDGHPADSLRQPGLPVASDARPLAVGGRVTSGGPSDDPPARRYSGHLDELRIWGAARPASLVRRLMNRPWAGSDKQDPGEKGGPRVMRLGFDESEPDAVQAEAAGAQRVPSTLSFRSDLRRLRAESEDRTVTLRWTAETGDLAGFVVERSANGEAFRPVATLDPAEAKRSTASDEPTFAYTERDVPGQVVFYRIRLREKDGDEQTSGTIKIGLGAEATERAPVRLIGNFPNPFSERTTVAYEVNERTPVTITVWNLQGHQIAELADGPKDPGYHEAPFTATDLPSGTYFVQLTTPTDEQSDRMVLLK